MWASRARFVGSCEGRITCMDWQESSRNEGGWLLTGCSSGTVGVSWINNKDNDDASVERCRTRGVEEDQGHDEEGGERETQTARKKTSGLKHEDNLACTNEACLYKSHFILRNHTGEVSTVI